MKEDRIPAPLRQMQFHHLPIENTLFRLQVLRDMKKVRYKYFSSKTSFNNNNHGRWFIIMVDAFYNVIILCFLSIKAMRSVSSPVCESEVICSHCKCKGHYSRGCPKKVHYSASRNDFDGSEVWPIVFKNTRINIVPLSFDLFLFTLSKIPLCSPVGSSHSSLGSLFGSPRSMTSNVLVSMTSENTHTHKYDIGIHIKFINYCY